MKQKVARGICWTTRKLTAFLADPVVVGDLFLCPSCNCYISVGNNHDFNPCAAAQDILVTMRVIEVDEENI